MLIEISLVLDTEKETSALSVVAQLNKRIAAGPPKLEKYHKGGTKVLLYKDLPETSWAEACYKALRLAQSFGRGWTLHGDTEEELNLVGTEFSISGIKWAELMLARRQHKQV